MKIRRFLAPTMRQALAAVREEFGEEAVILGNRRGDDGIEVICAADYDPALLAATLAQADSARVREAQDAGQHRAAAPQDDGPVEAPQGGFQAILARMAATRPPPASSAGTGPAAAARAAAAAPPRVVWSQDGDILAMRREVEALRRLLEAQLSRFAWDDLAKRDPFRARLLGDLDSLGIAPDLARRMADSMPAVTRRQDASRVALALLLKHLPVTDKDLLSTGGTFALVGPTGAGKTTTLAKMAAQFVSRHGAAAVGIVCVDGHRVGAREQLAALARILGVPMQVARTPVELSAARRQLARRRLVLIDTAGVGQRDLRLGELTALLHSQRDAVRPLLVLPANLDASTLADIIRAQRPLRPRACVITKIDETMSLGPVLSAVIRASLPIAQLCDGQRIPDDLYAAGGRRVWLIRKACKLGLQQGRAAQAAQPASRLAGAGSRA